MAHRADVGLDIAVQRTPGGVDVAIGELAGRQHGSVARWQLLGLGLTRNEIGARVGRLLHPVHRGVYAVGHRALSREGRWMAALLAGGPGTVLSHHPGAALFGIRQWTGGRIDVTVRTQRRRRPGLLFHHAVLPADETTVKHGIPVTSVSRTLFDLATILRPRQLERALNEAEVLGVRDQVSLPDLLHRYPRRRGNRAVRAVLAARGGVALTRSELEVAFLELVDESGLPHPEVNVSIEGLEVDCVWAGRRVIVELDGHAFHATRAAFDRDRERDRILQAAGWRVIRVTARQLERTRPRLEADLRRLLTRATLEP